MRQLLSDKKQKIKSTDKTLEDIYGSGGIAMSPFSQTQVIVKKKAIEPLTSSSGGTSSFSPAAPPKNKWVTSKIYPTSATLTDEIFTRNHISGKAQTQAVANLGGQQLFSKAPQAPTSPQFGIMEQRMRATQPVYQARHFSPSPPIPPPMNRVTTNQPSIQPLPSPYLVPQIPQNPQPLSSTPSNPMKKPKKPPAYHNTLPGGKTIASPILRSNNEIIKQMTPEEFATYRQFVGLLKKFETNAMELVVEQAFKEALPRTNKGGGNL
ncbi:hypothetical protein FGO68_gene8991 [Halteria grandinella]|uniref:Uncharacterized protein n=1 Tax=Halteria grandinella TaxID=5974 RepID=A0A8J8NA71_HALGN|nr:hypothetical protein FGO68_gene8991 [Halteria grandinella]